MRHMHVVLSVVTFALLLPSIAPAATPITGTVTAQQGTSYQVKFEPHESACPKVGDAVDFSLKIQNIKVKAGNGAVTRIEGNSVWVAIDPASKSKPRLKATGVIQATGQPDLSPLLKGKYDRFLKTKDRTLLNELETYARNGNPIAQTLMGTIYLSGIGGVSKNPVRAFQLFQQAAEQGYAQAMMKLAYALGTGQGTSRDVDTAMAWRLKALASGEPQIQYDLAHLYERGYDGVKKNGAEARKLYIQAAEQGHIMAQCRLALCYRLGEIVPRDFAQSARWWGKAAEQGDAEAQFELGNCYGTGLGVTYDLSEAFTWYLKAAEQGYKNAQFMLGQFYRLGSGAPRKPEEALKWYLKAAEQGDMMAMEELGNMYEKGDGIPKDRTEAIRWYRKAVSVSSWATDAQEGLKRLGAD